MLEYLLTLLYFTRLAQGILSNTTDTHSCPRLDDTNRSIWSILGTCGVTILICVWHTLHFDVPGSVWRLPLWWKVLCGIGSFFAPEALVMIAAREWWDARDIVNKFRSRGYQWSMTHSFFAEMGGFTYRDGDGDQSMEEDELPRINSVEFLDHCEKKEIVNPFIKVKEIKDKSKSDWLGKTILALQLIWFMLQAVIRGSRGLAVTLIELDTVCMAVLSLIVIIFWWHKPLGVAHPHVFSSINGVLKREKTGEIEPQSNPPPELITAKDKRALSAAWRPEPTFLDCLKVWFTWRRKPTTDEESNDLLTNGIPGPRSKLGRLVDKLGANNFTSVSFSVAWTVLGGLHLIAWNFEFPTETERTLWRIASILLTTTPIPYISLIELSEVSSGWAKYAVLGIAGPLGTLGLLSRPMLMGLMLASLRALPCSAHENVAWTIYIPHL